ncbi:MAG: 5'/3'-nucleotidase SurE [Clostridia bacterium]|nr:5'/3'-nucleotidase SurE [Clostridia bacterium]
MNILISNDDGVFKYGLKLLAKSLMQMEDANVYVCAPAQERSCAGHGLLLHEPILVEDFDPAGYEGAKAVWSCSGTPADSVKMGISILRTKGVEIDLVCTGINHGSNLGRDIHYSGTISAAMEGIFMHKPAIAFSLCSHEAVHFEAFPGLIPEVVRKAYRNLPVDTLLSVNVPDIPAEELKGVRVCPIGPRDYAEGVELVEATDKGGYWRYDAPAVYRDNPDPAWDVSAWKDGWVTLTPVQMMRENARVMDLVRSWRIGLEK